MKHLRLFFILLLTCCCLTSCFEIIEEVKIHTDGSGQLKYIINFSQSATKINSLLLLDEVEGKKVPSQEKIRSEFKKIVYKTEKVSGISVIKSAADMENYIFTYQCDFTKVEKLNALLDTIKGSKNDDLNLGESYFSYTPKTKTFKRKGDNLLKDQYDKMPDTQRAVFYGATYTCLYRFEEEIDSLKSVYGKLSKDKLTSFSKLDVLKLTDNGQYLNHEIKLK